jgi:large subunit ribosomal protein L10
MSKTVKNLIQRDMAERFKGVESAAVINPRGINAIKNNDIRRRLRAQGVRMTVVKNTLTRRALADSKLKGVEQLFEGPTALVYGEASIATIARMILEERRTDETLELRGVFFDGEIYSGLEGVQQVSKMPTREEAIGQLVALALAPGAKLAALLKGPGSQIGGILKTIEEKQKETEGAVA